MSYTLPKIAEPEKPGANEILMVASGDLRHSANKVCWAAQAEVEALITGAFSREGYKVKRAHSYDPELQHGLIYSQRMGMDIFANIHPEARLIVAEAVWQYSHHVLAGLRSHRGPILTIANWSGQWPGLVGLLNLNGCLTKAGVRFSTIWSEDFKDEFFLKSIRQWLKEGKITHDLSHVRDLNLAKLPAAECELGQTLAKYMKRNKSIMGIFDEGCMGMYNAIVEDELLNPLGIYKERLSQSALYAAMRDVTDPEAQAVRDWLDKRGMTFDIGTVEETDLTDRQILEQCKMYIAAVRIARDFGCDTIGIQYQQGLKDLAPASDLVEGLLNNPDRPPVYDKAGKELYSGEALPHFNEVDECIGVDQLATKMVWKALGMDPSSTLHDVRYGEWYKGNGIDDFVWVFMISGGVPASHIKGGYAGALSMRQPPMYFPFGGGTLNGVCKPGELVWSRVFVEAGKLHADLGRGRSIELPEEENERRLKATTSQWPIQHAILDGISRDQFMARHKANHICVAYADSPEMADKALAAKAAMFAEMGIEVHLCGKC